MRASGYCLVVRVADCIASECASGGDHLSFELELEHTSVSHKKGESLQVMLDTL